MPVQNIRFWFIIEIKTTQTKALYKNIHSTQTDRYPFNGLFSRTTR